jgi:hypothetical protein
MMKLMIIEIENQFYPNWILPTSTFDSETVSQVVKDAYEQQLKSDKIFVDKLMVLSKIEETLDNWKNKRNSNVDKRFSILKEGVTAHLKEKYYLSVSVLIPQIEGLLKDAEQEVGLKGVISWKDLDDRCLKNAVNTLMGKWKEEIWINNKSVDLLNENFPKVIAYLYKEYNSERDEENQLNRHGICHGIQTNFGTATSSLRLILIIDRIIFFMADDKNDK